MEVSKRQFESILKKSAIIPFQYYMKWFNDSFSMWMHEHDYFEIMYCSSGSFLVEISKTNDNKKIETHKISQGQFIFIKPNVYHKMVMESNEKAFVYNMEFSLTDFNNEIIKSIHNIVNLDFYRLFMETKLNLLLNNENGYIITNDNSQVGTNLKELILIMVNNQNTIENNIAIINKEVGLFLEISNSLTNGKIGEISYIRKANAYIVENYQRKLSLSEIAKHVNISTSYLKHQYKKQMGQTILGFINVLRVQKACKLLVNTSFPISKIANEVGYKDKNQLNYEFKRIIGQTPSSYRKNGIEKKVDYTNKNYSSTAIEPNK